MNHVEESGHVFQLIFLRRLLYWQFHHHHTDNTLVLLVTGTVRHDKRYLWPNSIAAGFRGTDGTCTQPSDYPTHVVNNINRWRFRSKFVVHLVWFWFSGIRAVSALESSRNLTDLPANLSAFIMYFWALFHFKKVWMGSTHTQKKSPNASHEKGRSL